MLRVCGMFGMGILFMLISPKLRQNVFDGLNSGVNGMEAHSPYSYVGLGVAVLIVGGISLYRGAQAR
jgi:hypothetical protein